MEIIILFALAGSIAFVWYLSNNKTWKTLLEAWTTDSEIIKRKYYFLKEKNIRCKLINQLQTHSQIMHHDPALPFPESSNYYIKILVHKKDYNRAVELLQNFKEHAGM